MVIKVSVHGIEVSFDIGNIINMAKRFAKRISDSKEQKQVEEFLKYYGFLVSNRKQAAILAGSYYRDRGLEILDDYVPILFKKGWIPQIPINLQNVRLEWLSHQKFDFDNSIYAKREILPFKEERYTSSQEKLIEKGILQKLRLYNAPTYRLIEIGNSGNDYALKFGLDTYYNYIDTCELVAFEFCKFIMDKIKRQKISEDTIKDGLRSSLRSQIEPFDFKNRSAAVGINTVLIVLNGKQPSKFYLHQRSAEEVAEAINTIHIVPAGTFQPRHEKDTYHSQDFNLYTNLIREFAEELLGKEEFRELSTKFNNIYEVDILKKINFFVKHGFIKVYHLGIGLDCLTLKPEILTVLVLQREIINTFLWHEFTDCFEGKSFESEFSIEQLDTFIKDEKMLPAGAACLWLVRKNFAFFVNAFK